MNIDLFFYSLTEKKQDVKYKIKVKQEILFRFVYKLSKGLSFVIPCKARNSVCKGI